MDRGIGQVNSRKLSNHTYCVLRLTKSCLAAFAALAALSVASSATAACTAGTKKVCARTISNAGQTGLTSYSSLPFVSSVYQLSWGSSPSLSPGNLFWDKGTNFTNPITMANARIAAAALTAQGVVAASGSQRWEDTYEASQPSSPFPGEPGWINDDRQSLAGRSDFKAWATWQKAHENLFMVAADGGSTSPSFRPWKGSYGHISPMMPLPESDWPAGMKNATYGDWYAYRWGQTAKLSGAYAIQLSDFSDSQPGDPTFMEGFNPQIVAAFATSIGKAIPGTTIGQRANYINANLTPQWNDFMAAGYANFFKSLATQLGANTGQQGLVIDQCGMWPSVRRFYAIDQRKIASAVGPSQYICLWDDQTMQVGRSGQPMIWGIGAMVLGAAREPDIRNGANLSADDDAFWQATATFWKNLSPADQKERGLKEMKRAWLETAWSQIATREGGSRRAMAFMSRDYWDVGKIDGTVQRLMQTVVPTKPFGYALYYSTAAERQMEPAVAATGNLNGAYMNPDILMNFKQGGGAVNYYVSDAGLPNLTAAAKPAAWLVLDGTLSATELSKLKAVAPVLTSLAAAKSFANAPLTYSTRLTGIGFYDQSNRLIVTATNPAAASLNGKITLKGLPTGKYVATDLVTNAKVAFSVTTTGGSVPVTVARWDTRVFAIVAG
jgi:hypothetical protein